MTDAQSDLITPEERGETRAGSRIAGRLLLVLFVTAASVVIVLVGNYIATGRMLPWLSAVDAQPESVLTTPTPGATAGAADPAALVRAEDARLANLAGLAPADPRTLDEFNTVVLGARAEPYGVADLLGTGALRQDDDATFTLQRNVVVRSGAQLLVHAPGASIRMLSSPAGTVSIVGWGGGVELAGAEGAPLTLVSWNADAAVPDTDVADGRAYLRVRDATLRASDVRFERLGYWSGRTGGLAVTATDFALAGVELTRTEHIGMHYGFFGSALSSGALSGVAVSSSAMSGIELTNGSQNIAMSGASVSDAGGDGIRIDRGTGGVTVAGATVQRARDFGLRIDGRALADGPSPGGYATTSARGVSVIDSTVRDNGAGGVWMMGVDEALLQGLTADAAQTAVRVDGPAVGVRIEGGAFTSTEYRGLVVADGATGVVVNGVAIAGPRVAVEARRSDVLLTGSRLTVDVGHPVELRDRSRMDIVGNAYVGTGQSPIVTMSGSRSVARDNDAGQWHFQIEFVAWMNEHPMMWMWALVLVIPALGVPLLARRRRKHRELRRLLEDAIIRYGKAQLDAHASPSAPAAEPVDPSPAPGRAQPASPVVERAQRDEASPLRAAGPVVPVRPPRRPPPRPETASTGSIRQPRTFGDLRTGALANREFDSLQQFAVAAVLEAGYPITTIARLFRVPSWKLQTWVEETLSADPRART